MVVVQHLPGKSQSLIIHAQLNRRPPLRQSSSSSIPSDAEGSEDSRTPSQRRHDQEGPAGKGPGQHEPQIKLNDGPLHDSPQSHHDDLPSIPPPRGSAGDGAATPVPPEYFRENAKEDIPASEQGQQQEKGKGAENGHANGTTDFDPEEHVEPRDSETNRKMTDEVGRYPEGLDGVKGENPPGSQNEIVLGPRVPLMHVSTIFKSFG